MERVQRKKMLLAVVVLFAALFAVYCGVVLQGSVCDPADSSDWSTDFPLPGVITLCLSAFFAGILCAAQGFAEPLVIWTASLRCYYGGFAGVENIIIRC